MPTASKQFVSTRSGESSGRALLLFSAQRRATGREEDAHSARRLQRRVESDEDLRVVEIVSYLAQLRPIRPEEIVERVDTADLLRGKVAALRDVAFSRA